MTNSRKKHQEKIISQFTSQAQRFDQKGYSLSNKEYLTWALENIPLNKDMVVLDVAAGTGILARELAGAVHKVYALDATASMLAAGEKLAEEAGLENVIFERGLAEALPYPDQKFDLVTCRLAFHHFYDYKTPFLEMVRVTKKGGFLVVMDLISPADAKTAARYNELETLRDDSHIYALTEKEFISLFQNHGLQPVKVLNRDVEMVTEDWLNLTKAPKNAREAIFRAFEAELKNGEETGMRPFKKEGALHFLHRWILVLAQKPA
ncbi:MAG TPA: methyltransferase domain-containing protein [Firmicutes bacterium]|nr:methyltransferase domain-containing protein [Bacillota bacterium]